MHNKDLVGEEGGAITTELQYLGMQHDVSISLLLELYLFPLQC